MNQPELQKFAQQLATWTELIIENGRTPFRRVDLYPEIHTAQGILQPPLVFWINRQSMMAGGILLLPEQNLEQQLEYGRSCCEALGLKHFVTWENDRVRVWQQDSTGVHQHQELKLKNADHPDSFRHLLGEVLEALKLLAVIGLTPTNELSAHYLHNLLATTLELGLPALIHSYRNQRAEEELNAAEDADQLATEANRLLLLQLLGLAWHQQLPTAILPEKLERAIQLSLPQLPEPLRQALSLSVTATPPALPHETAVCFHHLLLRLRQLSWRQPEQRALAGIEQLVAGWYTETLVPQAPAEVQLYPQIPVLDSATRLVLSDSPSLLAATALQQDLQQQPHKELQLGNLFQLHFNTHTALSVAAVLTKHRLLSRQERQQYATRLRTSWPNRRLRIGNDKPLWYWELIHLLGLSKEQRELRITLPLAALRSSLTEPFWPLLFENYSLRQVHLHTDELICMHISPDTHQEHPTEVILSDQTRTLSPVTELATFRHQLLLALQLPTEVYQLLNTKLIWPAEEQLDATATAGFEIYQHSSLWRLLKQVLVTNPPGKADELPQQEASWPRPDALHLKELARLAETAAHTPDQMLAELLQIPTIESQQVANKKATRSKAACRDAERELEEELVQQLQTDGVPTFPEQYLYFLEQPEMTTYQLTPPLKIISELLGEIELQDAGGQTLQVYGEELANALLLCSQLGKTTVELPIDRQQLAKLIQQYGDDLTALHKQLNSLCHSHLKSPKAASKMAKKVWKRLNLPKRP